MALKLRPTDEWAPNPLDLLKRCRRNLFGCVEKFFLQLLALSQPGKPDANFALRPSGKPNQRTSEVEDPDRLAHIEDQGVTTFSNGKSLQDQRNGLTSGHEESF